MAIQTTSNLANSIAAVYIGRYFEFVMQQRLYDQLAIPVPGVTPEQAMRGSSVVVPFLSGMQPAITALSQTADITPQALVDATASITPTSRGDALQWSEAVDFTVYTNLGEERIKRLAQQQSESIELLAIEAACQGSWFMRAAARASLDAGTSGHRASDAIFAKVNGLMLSRRVPGFSDAYGRANTWMAIMHPFPFHDIVESGNVDAIGLYQDMGIHLNYELGKIGNFRLVVSPFAKVFLGAGADNATNVDTTLASQAERLSKTIVTSTDVSASIAAGLQWMVGTEETGNTFYPTNEAFHVASASTTTLTIIGGGENDGLRFKHEAGESVRNADSVYTIVFGGPGSLVKMYDPETGEYGSPPIAKRQGLADQFQSLAWKFYGGYGRLNEKSILRVEVSTSYEA